MTAQEEDPKVLFWLLHARERGGSFVSRFAQACLAADAENYPLLRSALMVLMQKYSQYSPSPTFLELHAREAADRESLAAGERSTIGRFTHSVRTWLRKMVG